MSNTEVSAEVGETVSKPAEGEKPVTSREETMDTTETSSVASTSSNTAAVMNDDKATTTTNNNSVKKWTDEEAAVLGRAKEHMRKDQILAAARLLNQLGDLTVSGANNNNDNEDALFQKEVTEKAALVEKVMADLLTNPEEHDNAGNDGEEKNDEENAGEKWIKMGESHNAHRDTVMYYQLTEDLQLKCRLETPIESSLLVPLLSVLIETDLYMSWLPKWRVPRIGLASVEKLAQMGRTEQIIQFMSVVPWPFTARDVILQTCACDDIDDIEGDDDTTGAITIGLVSLQEGDQVRKSTVCNPHYEHEKELLVIPPPPDGLKRAEFDGGLLIRKCPPDHVSLQNSTIQYPPNEHLILVGFSMRIDGKISPLFPKQVINFVISTAIVQMWAMFLKVAEEIREGSRPEHAQAIAAKREEIYDWVDKRIEDMFAHFEKQHEHQNTSDDPAHNHHNENNSGDTNEEKKEDSHVTSDN